jgi:putative two-component system response regulator
MHRYKIILVDDNMASLTMGRNMLKTFYEVYPAPSAEKMFEILKNISVDLILLDIDMPGMNGYDAIKKLKADERFVDIPVIFLTAKTDKDSELEGFDLGAMDYVSKPFSAPLLLKRIETQLLIVEQKKDLLESHKKLKEYAETLKSDVLEKTKEISELQSTVLTTVADLVEFRDKLTGGHIMRTQLYIKAMVDYMQRNGVLKEELAKWEMDLFLRSVQLHDVGKIGISDLILNKPGPLTKEEMCIMKTHVDIGVDAVEKIISSVGEHAFLNHALLVVGTHHEKWDGTGYPTGLKGKNIPLEGRLMAIADVYDALISARPYKEPMPPEKAGQIIEVGAGSHFDPELLEVFKQVKEEFAKIAAQVKP